MKTLSLLFSIIFCSILLFSCKPNEATDQTRHIPADANFVLTLNANNILKKLQSANMDFSSLAGGDETARQKLELTRQAVNLDKPVYVFTKSKASITTGKTSVTATVASLKNKDAVLAYLSKFQPGAQVKRTENFTFTTGDNSSVGWNDNTIIFINGSPDEQQLLTLFTMNKELSMGAKDIFNKSLNPSADATFFMNTAAFLLTNPTLAVSKLSILLKDTYTSGNINFNNGSVDGDMQTVYGQEFQSMIQNNPSPANALNLIQRYPEQPGSIFSLSVNPNLLKALAEYAGIKALAEQYLGSLGITADEALSALGGNFALASSNITPNMPLNKLTQANFKSLLSGNYILSAGIQNRSALDKIVSVLGTTGFINNTTGFITVPFFGNAGTPGVMKIDSNLVYGSSADFINRFYQAATGFALPQDIQPKLQNKVLAFYLDGQTIFQQLHTKFPAESSYPLAKTTFRDFYLYSDKLAGNSSKGAFSLRLINNNQNSLAAILQFLNAVSKITNAPAGASLPLTDTTAKPAGIPDEDVLADPDVIQGTKPPKPL